MKPIDRLIKITYDALGAKRSCSICGFTVNRIEIKTKGWGKAQRIKKIIRDHIRECHLSKEEDRMTDFRLKRAILKSGMKQLAIAERAGIQDVRFSKIVNGHIEPTDKEKFKIAEAMGIEQERIFP